MSIRRIIVLAILGLYTIVVTVIFLKVAKYWFSSLYFVGFTVIWFKIYEYGKKKERSRI